VITLFSANLTRAHNPRTSAMIEASRPGMAHFAGTGPEGRSCRECIHWSRKWKDIEHDESIKSGEFKYAHGVLMPRRCRKFWRMMNRQRGKSLPHRMASCRHFSENPDAPPVVKPAKEKRR
jgi:hypothetical protein